MPSSALMLPVRNDHILSTDPLTAAGHFVNPTDHPFCATTMMPGEEGNNGHLEALLQEGVD